MQVAALCSEPQCWDRAAGRTKGHPCRVGLSGVSTPSGNGREQKSHRKHCSHREGPQCARVTLSCWPGASRGDPAVSQPPVLPRQHKVGRAKPVEPYLSGELSLGRSCPFSWKSPSVVSAPDAALGLGARLGLGASIPRLGLFPGISWSILVFSAPGEPEGRASSFSCSAFPEAEDGSFPRFSVPGIFRALGTGSGAVLGILSLELPFSRQLWVPLALPRLFPTLPKLSLGMVPMWLYMSDERA